MGRGATAPSAWRRHFAVWLGLVSGWAAMGNEPLHVRIDQIVEKTPGGVVGPVASDSDFLRRVYLDLLGVPPTAGETRAYLGDQNPQKRQAVVDRLLADPRYPRHMALVFDVMLMERRPNQHVSADDWHQYLYQSFRENKPYSQLAREILGADGSDPKLRPAVRFYLDRGAEPHLLTRDIGRIFFGRDLQCAQCHDHPLIEDYLQADYHGLLAFVEAGYAFAAPEPDKMTYYAERAGSLLSYESVFDKGTRYVTGPRLFGAASLAEPAFYPGDEYQVKPADKVRAVPKFSRRAQLASLATDGTNRAFNENIANRLWAHLMGRGLVHPVDLQHAGNPPTHPELLRLLGEQLAAMKFDVKAFLRQLALTRTYQRAIDLPPNVAERAAQAPAVAGELDKRRADQEKIAEAATAAYLKSLEEWNTARTAAKGVRADLDKALAQGTEAAKKVDAAEKAVAQATAQLSSRQEAAQAVAEAAAKAQAAVAKLPKDQELVQAAQKFAEREKQLAGEVAKLRKTVEEKQAGLQPPNQELAAARKGIDAARAKLAPLEQTIQQKEQAFIAARAQARQEQTQWQRTQMQLASLKRLAQLQSLHGAAATAGKGVEAANAKLGEARQAASGFAAVVAQRENDVKAAQTGQAEAESVLAARRGELGQKQKAVEALVAAAAQAESARQQIPDPVVADAAAKLKAKADELHSALGEFQKQLDAAASSAKLAAEKTAAAQQALQAARTEMTQRQQAVAAAEQTHRTAQEQLEARRMDIESARAQLAEDSSSTFLLAALKPLTPEQMCWSILRVTGVVDRQAAAEEAELNKTSPLSDEIRKDAAKMAARAFEIEQRVYNKLKGNVGVFVSFFAAAPGQPQNDFFATADQALFAANGGQILSWIAPAGGNVAERIVQQADAKAAAEDLYLTVLGRLPGEAESADVAQYLAARPQEKAACVQELIWALVTSAEFRFNH